MNAGNAGQAASPSRGELVQQRTAAHVGDSMRNTRRRVHQAVIDVPQLCHVGHFADSDWNFSVEVEPVLTDYAALGCNLIGVLANIEDVLAPIGTGPLIRSVGHAEGGALVCHMIVPGERLVGVTLERRSRQSLRNEFVRHADNALGLLVDELRLSIGQMSQNQGGYGRAGLTGDPLTWQPSAISGGPEQLAGAVLNPTDLQFVAVVRNGSVISTRDVFDDPAAEEYFRAKFTPARRRDFYLQFVPQLGFYARRIAGIANAAIGRGLNRLVLDVQWGAILYYRIDLHRYLVGVTLNQDAVIVADLKTEWLSEALSISERG